MESKDSKIDLEHVETPDSQRVNRLMSNLDLRINEYNKEKETIDKAKEFMDSKYDLYVRNYNIIAHIRNAFAHGNVRIMNHISGDTLNDRVILIEDNYEGKCTYRLVITYKKFRKLFSNYNTDIVYKFVSDKAMGAAINKGLVKKPE